MWYFTTRQGCSGRQVPLRLMATAITYFLANTIPVAAVVPLPRTARFPIPGPNAISGRFLTTSSALLSLGSSPGQTHRLGWQASALMIPVIYVMYRSYRLYLGKLEDEKNHVEQMAALHLRTIEALALAIDAKDHTTHEHLQRVRVFAVEIGQGNGA